MQNAEELANKFEGDIVLTEDQADFIFGRNRNGLVDVKSRWLNRTVPYELSPNHTDEHNVLIEDALKQIAAVSCLRFVRRTSEPDYVKIQAEPSGCWSFVGRTGGAQRLNLHPHAPGKGCFKNGTVIHEFLHGKR